jgi:acetyltransferase
MLSVGNQADLQFHEYLDCFGDDPDTRAIISYIEGFKDGPAYLAAARRVSPRKPIVVYAVGRTAEGKGAARSHSGSLSADHAVTRGVLRQAGVVLVEQSDHLFPVADALMLFPPMRGCRVAVLSEGGGPISIAAETLAQCGLELATLTPQTQQKIHAIVPNATAIANPVDAGGGTEPRVEYYGSISKLILEDPNIDALLLVGFFGGYVTAPTRYGADVADTEAAIGVELAADMRRLGKPVIVQSHYAHLKTSSLDALRKAGVPYERHVETAVRCLAHAAEQGQMRRRLAEAETTPTQPVRLPAANAIVAAARSEGRDLLEPEARALLAAHGVPMAPSVLMKDAGDAADAVARLGGVPLALKIVSRDVLHKSDVGGVRLDLTGAAAVAEAFDAIVRDVRAHQPDADIAGVLATPMAARGVELIVGVVQDPQYGRVLMVGLGGVFVEAMRDVVFRAVPVSKADAIEMLGEIRAQAMLEGMRGLPAVDRGAIADLLVKVSSLAIAYPELAAIDLNPVVAHLDGYAVVDSRMLLAGA